MLISRTQINPHSPYAHTINRGGGSPQENLCEFAARHCYASEDNMGHNPNFLSSLVKRGHMDVFEHSWVALHLNMDDAYYLIAPDKWLYRHSEFFGYVMSGSLRIWLRSINTNTGDTITNTLSKIAPHLFGEQKEYNSRFVGEYNPFEKEYIKNDTRVSLLAANVGYEQGKEWDDIHSATIMINGISRACSHQIVRHRNLSFSMQSQRYVDLEKSSWNIVIPDGFDDTQTELLKEFWNLSQQYYTKLREVGARKEDARFVLPNACSTSMVVTGNFTSWKHFLDLRLPRNAQWEIRGVAQAIRDHLKWIAPLNFEDY